MIALISAMINHWQYHHYYLLLLCGWWKVSILNVGAVWKHKIILFLLADLKLVFLLVAEISKSSLIMNGVKPVDPYGPNWLLRIGQSDQLLKYRPTAEKSLCIARGMYVVYYHCRQHCWYYYCTVTTNTTVTKDE